MNMSYISGNDWNVLFQKYPFVKDYLTHCSLVGELKILYHEKESFKQHTYEGRVKWVDARITELETLFGSTLYKNSPEKEVTK